MAVDDKDVIATVEENIGDESDKDNDPVVVAVDNNDDDDNDGDVIVVVASVAPTTNAEGGISSA